MDSTDAFDYENPDNAKFTADDLRYILHEEILVILQAKFHQFYLYFQKQKIYFLNIKIFTFFIY